MCYKLLGIHNTKTLDFITRSVEGYQKVLLRGGGGSDQRTSLVFEILVIIIYLVKQG